MSSDLNYKYPATPSLFLIETALRRYNEWVVDKFLRVFHGQPSIKRVLDFGSGVGTLAKIFFAQTGIKPDTFDVDAGHRQEMEKAGYRAYADTGDLPLAYELVYTSNVLEHIADDLDTLRIIHTKLAPDGILLIYVPAFMFLWTSMDDMVEHCRRYSRAELNAKLSATGYVVEKSVYCDSAGFLLSLFFKYTDRKNGVMPLRSLYLYDKYVLPVSRVIDRLCGNFFGKNIYVIARKSA